MSSKRALTRDVGFRLNNIGQGSRVDLLNLVRDDQHAVTRQELEHGGLVRHVPVKDGQFSVLQIVGGIFLQNYRE